MDVVLVDSSLLSASDWADLERLSSAPERPTIVLLDAAHTRREQLAIVKIDQLLPGNASPDTLARVVNAHLPDQAFRAAAATIRTILPYPLSRFLAEVFIQPEGNVGRVVTALSLKYSTVRSQWRRWRSDPAVRLEDVVRATRRIRTMAYAGHPEWRDQLHQLLQFLLAAGEWNGTGHNTSPHNTRGRR